MIAAVEKQKFVYVLNRDAAANLTISSPLEAHKSHNVAFAVAALDCGFDNPVFATIELDYSDADQDPSGEAAAAAQKQLVYYELDLGLNHVVRIWGGGARSVGCWMARIVGPLSDVRLNHVVRFGWLDGLLIERFDGWQVVLHGARSKGGGVPRSVRGGRLGPAEAPLTRGLRRSLSLARGPSGAQVERRGGQRRQPAHPRARRRRRPGRRAGGGRELPALPPPGAHLSTRARRRSRRPRSAASPQARCSAGRAPSADLSRALWPTPPARPRAVPTPLPPGPGGAARGAAAPRRPARRPRRADRGLRGPQEKVLLVLPAPGRELFGQPAVLLGGVGGGGCARPR